MRRSGFFIKGPTSDPANIVDGSVPANLKTELSYNSVPTDPHPHVDSLVLPGPDNLLGTADDIPVGSLMTWNVTSLVFNLGKSRVRGTLPAGGHETPREIIWDVISPPDDIVQRAYVAAGPGDRPESSSFLVAYETVEDVVLQGPPEGRVRRLAADEAGGCAGTASRQGHRCRQVRHGLQSVLPRPQRGLGRGERSSISSPGPRRTRGGIR